MFLNTTVSLEKNKRFSESVLWQYQMDYFDSEGINAWNGQVPFFITSNPHIGYLYASTVVSYVKDLIRLGQFDRSKPLYLIELGTGSGQFSFYLLKSILEQLSHEGLEDVQVRYIMSDFTNSNVEFWRSQPNLRTYLEQGLLDFAQFNLITDTEIYLLERGKTLTSAECVNGLVIFGNYIFDTIPHDAFKVDGGKLYELSSFVDTKKDNLDKLKPKNLSDLNVHFKQHQIKGQYADYNDNLMKVLGFYQENLSEGSFLFPVAGITAMDRLNALAGGKTLLLTSDKGYTHLSETSHRQDPVVIFHGSFSMMVNFHAYERYNSYCGGDGYLQACHPGLKSCAFLRGFSMKDMKCLASALERNFGGFSPAEYFHLHTLLRREPIDYDLKTVISYLVLSRWDPYVFRLVNKQISNVLQEVSTAHLEILDLGMDKIEENIFTMPNDDDAFFDLGYYCHLRGRYAQAIDFYLKSIDRFAARYVSYYNLGICYYEQSDFDHSVQAFQQSLNIEPNQTEAQKWLDRARMASRVNPT